jgi:hypothetical protein
MANNPNDFNSRISKETATIVSGQTESNIIYTYGTTISGVIFPAAFDGADIKFFSSIDKGSTFQQMYKIDGSEEFVPVVLNGNVDVDYQAFARVEIVKIVAATIQGADRELGISLRAYA